MGAVTIFLYGVIAYVVFLFSFLYAIGFLGNFLVPKSIDSGAPVDLIPAVVVNLLLLGLFAVQHSVMARPAFKRWWTQYVPPAAERSTYVLLTSLILFLIYWLWQPLPGVIWSVENTIGVYILWGLFALGWLIVLLSTFLIDHFDLFGLRQVWLHLRGREYTPPEFCVHMLYRYVRHPIMLGFIIAFWATPHMSTGHLLFAVTTTAYILIGVALEERDLIRAHGANYLEYRKKVPMIIPALRRRQ
ncbi:MAG: NnrU family protein [Gammaproteobacteria bacterium]|nr:NnrU family protein [Gammaproteobacteria bacterium]